MIVKNSDIALNEAFGILDNAQYLTEAESLTAPITVPVVECARLNTHLVDHADIMAVAESYGYDPFEALCHIAEANGLDVDDCMASISEDTLVGDPSVVAYYSNYAIAPLAESWEDQAWFDLCLEEAGGKAAGADAEKVAKEAEKSKDPNIITKAIARLRKIYREWMNKVRDAEKKYEGLSDAEKKDYKDRPAFYKRVAAKILGWIDRLMSKLQYFSDRRKGSEMSADEVKGYKADAERWDRKYDKLSK